MEIGSSIIFPSNSIDEQILEVTEDNFPVGPVHRKLVRQEKIWHRASYVFVKNSKGEL